MKLEPPSKNHAQNGSRDDPSDRDGFGTRGRVALVRVTGTVEHFNFKCSHFAVTFQRIFIVILQERRIELIFPVIKK